MVQFAFGVVLRIIIIIIIIHLYLQLYTYKHKSLRYTVLQFFCIYSSCYM